MPWVTTRPGLPYFLEEAGSGWTPIGANDAISWPELAPLFRRKNLPAVEAHLTRLREQGVTCLRLMLEYCQGDHRYLERPAGFFQPDMVRLWDDLFAMLARTSMRVLLTPYDTFFMWNRWGRHPYYRKNGGPCSSRRRWLTCPDTRKAIKRRLAFASDRWGADGTIFAWDLWNEISPAHGGDDSATLAPFIAEIGDWLRQREMKRYGRAHLQTVSVFGPLLVEKPATIEPIFRHPALDFASTHLYDARTIDNPRDTIAPAMTTGQLIRAALRETNDMRPVLDTEHGPIHRFKDRRRTLPEAFDDEYFRHIQWAHLASGGAGGGMRWPNRHPHVLTTGMRRAQNALAQFLPLIDWSRFHRENISDALVCSAPDVAVFACADADQAVIWLLPTAPLDKAGRLVASEQRTVEITVSGMRAGAFRIQPFDTLHGKTEAPYTVRSDGDGLRFPAVLTRDLALAVKAC